MLTVFVGAFSGHCEPSGSFVDTSNGNQGSDQALSFNYLPLSAGGWWLLATRAQPQVLGHLLQSEGDLKSR